MELDKETVQVAAIAAGTAIAVTSLVVDGELGYAMGTGILTLAGTISGYWWGIKQRDVEEVEKNEMQDLRP